MDMTIIATIGFTSLALVGIIILYLKARGK